MSEDEQAAGRIIALSDVAEALRSPALCGNGLDELRGVDQVERVTAQAGTVLVQRASAAVLLAGVLEGEIRAERPEPDGSMTTVGICQRGEGFGEVPLLHGQDKVECFVITRHRRFGAAAFHRRRLLDADGLLPGGAQGGAGEHGAADAGLPGEALHREKLVSLGTLAAGLMHELNNPGSAAKRAASQLRENLMRLQQLSLRFSDQPKTPEQLECMRGLLEHTHARLPCAGDEQHGAGGRGRGDGASGSTAAGVENAYTHRRRHWWRSASTSRSWPAPGSTSTPSRFPMR